MDPYDAEIINDLLAVCQEGETFYREAVEYTRIPAMQSTFHRMAAIKAEIVNDLKPCMASADYSYQRNVMLVYGLQQSYKAIKAGLASGDEHESVARIQVLEQCVLNLMEDALDKLKTDELHELLKMWHTTAAAAYKTIRNKPPLMVA